MILSLLKKTVTSEPYLLFLPIEYHALSRADTAGMLLNGLQLLVLGSCPPSSTSLHHIAVKTYCVHEISSNRSQIIIDLFLVSIKCSFYFFRKIHLLSQYNVSICFVQLLVQLSFTNVVCIIVILHSLFFTFTISLYQHHS